MKSRCIFYVCTGPVIYLERLAFSIATLRHHYDGKVMVVSSHPLECLKVIQEMFEVSITKIESCPKETGSKWLSRRLKTSIYEYSRAAEGLFLDTDILVLQDPSSGWGYLNESKPLGLVHPEHKTFRAFDSQKTVGGMEARAKFTPEYCSEWEETLKEIPPEMDHFNSGVIYWRKSSLVEAIFSAWYREWSRYGRWDQLALSRALWKEGQERYAILPCRYNNLRPVEIEPDMVLFHGTQDNWKRVNKIDPEAYRLGQKAIQNIHDCTRCRKRYTEGEAGGD
jgi:hypothetical protein